MIRFKAYRFLQGILEPITPEDPAGCIRVNYSRHPVIRFKAYRILQGVLEPITPDVL